MIVDELIEAVELRYPQEILARIITENLKVLDLNSRCVADSEERKAQKSSPKKTQTCLTVLTRRRSLIAQ